MWKMQSDRKDILSTAFYAANYAGLYKALGVKLSELSHGNLSAAERYDSVEKLVTSCNQ